MKNASLTTKIFWGVYVALLLVLLPHTAWLFLQFEPSGTLLGKASAWAGAIAFESAIAVLTHKLAQHIQATPRRLTGKQRLAYRWINEFSIGLIVAVGVSALANLAHSVEFGRSLAIFTAWSIEPKVYQLAFGGVLPLVSLLFARVLSNVSETEEAPNPELEKANDTIRALRLQLRDTEHRAKAAEDRANTAEQRFGAAGDLFARLFAEDKRQRILAIKTQWPALPGSAIAKMTESSPAYVSEVLSSASVDVDA